MTALQPAFLPAIAAPALANSRILPALILLNCPNTASNGRRRVDIAFLEIISATESKTDREQFVTALYTTLRVTHIGSEIRVKHLYQYVTYP